MPFGEYNTMEIKGLFTYNVFLFVSVITTNVKCILFIVITTMERQLVHHPFCPIIHIITYSLCYSHHNHWHTANFDGGNNRHGLKTLRLNTPKVSIERVYPYISTR